MVADFVDQCVFDECCQGKIMVAPISKQRFPVEKNHVGLLRRWLEAVVVADRHAVIEAEQIVRAFQRHRLFRSRIRKVFDPNDHTAQMLAEGFR